MRKYKNTIKFVQQTTEPIFNCMCCYLGFNCCEVNILKLRYRSGNLYTREYIAEEIGVSTATLDRKTNSMLCRIEKYCFVQ